MSHGNRSKNKPRAGREPSADELKRAREAAGLSREQAADLIYTSPRNWEAWEQASNVRRMPASAFELFMLKSGQCRRLQNGRVELANGAVIEVKGLGAEG
jgi:hypothetical protein